MSKRSDKKSRMRDKSSPLNSEPFTNNAFASLAGLSSELPGMPSPPAPRAKASADEAEETPRFPHALIVRMEKKGRAGKTVTRISGVPKAALGMLCLDMKKALGCGATVDGADLLLLGNLVARACAWFDTAGAKKVVRGN